MGKPTGRVQIEDDYGTRDEAYEANMLQHGCKLYQQPPTVSIGTEIKLERATGVEQPHLDPSAHAERVITTLTTMELAPLIGRDRG